MILEIALICLGVATVLIEIQVLQIWKALKEIHGVRDR